MRRNEMRGEMFLAKGKMRIEMKLIGRRSGRRIAASDYLGSMNIYLLFSLAPNIFST
jgi:TolB-like protein